MKNNTVFSLKDLSSLASETIFDRGQEYTNNVQNISISFDASRKIYTASARVSGTEEYMTRILWDTQKRIRTYSCSCPYNWSDCCKHIIALGIKVHGQMTRGTLRLPKEKIQKKQTSATLNISHIHRNKTPKIHVYISTYTTSLYSQDIQVQFFLQHKILKKNIGKKMIAFKETLPNDILLELQEEYEYSNSWRYCDFDEYVDLYAPVVSSPEWNPKEKDGCIPYKEKKYWGLQDDNTSTTQFFLHNKESEAFVFKDIQEIKKIASYSSLEDNKIMVDADSIEKIKKLGKILYKNSKKKNWIFHISPSVPPLKHSSTTVKTSFDIQLTDSGLLEFDLDFQLKKKKTTPEELMEIIMQKGGVIETEDEYITITNASEILEILEKFSQVKPNEKGKKEIPLWMMTEVESYINRSKNFSAQRGEKYKIFLEESKKGKPIEPIRAPQSLQKILRPYQKKSLHWLAFLRKYGFGGILADDMGLGKTLQTLCFITWVTHQKKKSQRNTAPFCIICPKTLLFNWEEEIQKWTPDLSVLTISGSPKLRKELIAKKNWKKFDIILTSYSLVKQDIEFWEKENLHFDTIFIDEAQHIKNHTTKTTQSIKKIPSKNYVALTGTPLENGVSEIWSIFDFLMCGFFGNQKQFKQQFQTPITKHGDKQSLKTLSEKVKPFLMRRTKEKVLKDLPQKIEQNSYAQLSKTQLAAYGDVLDIIREKLDKTVQEKGFEKSQIEILSALLKLRQICNHAVFADKKFAGAKSGKMELFIELVHDAMEGDHKVLVFSSFVQTLKILETLLQKENIKYSYLDGQTKDRQKEVKNFSEDPQKKIFLISLKAGGTGLNLTAADTVILFDPWWNPMVEMQAMDRAHRIGQKKVVNVYSLITKGTIEEKMLAIKKRKKALFDGIVGNAEGVMKKLSWDDIQDLFTFG